MHCSAGYCTNISDYTIFSVNSTDFTINMTISSKNTTISVITTNNGVISDDICVFNPNRRVLGVIFIEKCGENRNHGKFKIYFLNILSDYRFKSCQMHVCQ